MTPTTFQQVLTQSRRQGIDTQCFSETNPNTADHFVQQSLARTLKKFDPMAQSVWAATEMESATSFLPGGTSIVTFQSAASRITDTGKDATGRWTCVSLEAKENEKVLIDL